MHLLPLTVRMAARIFCGCGLLTGWLMVSAPAADVTNAPNYFMRVWLVEKGLPQNKVTSVVQTQDGYLWVGTYSGLARFDGMRFTVFDNKNTPEMHSRRVTSLFESSDGMLWIGHENGEVTTCKDGKFQPVKIRAAWVSRKISAITADAAGDVWLLNGVGLLARVRDGLVLSPSTGTATKLLSLARTTDGSIWVARDGRLSVLEHGQLRVVYPDWPLTNTTYVQGIGASRDGGIWVASNGRIRKWKDEHWMQDLGAAPWELAPLSRLIETKNGTLVAPTSNTGIFLLFPGTDEPTQHINHFNGLEADWITSLAEDREGDLWLGSGGTGLIEMRLNNIQTVEPPDHWRGHALLCAGTGRNGELWIGTEGAGLYCFQNGDWKNFGYTNFTGNSFVWSVAEDVAGQLFAGTLLARGYTGGKEILTDKVETTGAPAVIQLTPHRPTIKADGEDVSVITVQANDAQGRAMPNAGNAIIFEISGPGKIIGVGNGDPSSHEPDQFVESVSSLALTGWRSTAVDSMTNRPEVAADFDDTSWQTAFTGRGGGGGGRRGNTNQPTQITVYRGSFELPQNSGGAVFALALRSLGQEQSVYLNGQTVAENVSRENASREINLAAAALRPGKNVIAIVATPAQGGRGNRGGGGRANFGAPGQIRVTTSPGDWKRSLFSGLAQVIVQSTGQPGEITLTAKSSGVTDGMLKIQAQPAPHRPAVAAN